MSIKSVLRNRSSWAHPPEHEADHREADPGHGARDRRLVVSDETPTLEEPSKGAFYDPTLWQHDEPMLLRQLGNYNQPEAQLISRPVLERALVGRICEDHLEPRVLLPAELGERGPSTDRVMNVGLVHMQRMHEPHRIHHQVALSSTYEFASVEATYPPFSVVFTDCESMITALGVGSLPSFIRTSARSAS